MPASENAAHGLRSREDWDLQIDHHRRPFLKVFQTLKTGICLSKGSSKNDLLKEDNSFSKV